MPFSFGRNHKASLRNGVWYLLCGFFLLISLALMPFDVTTRKEKIIMCAFFFDFSLVVSNLDISLQRVLCCL